jgi:hypothetical protein
LVIEIVPHALAAAVLGEASGPGAWLVWLVLALVGWTLVGATLGLLLSLFPPLRRWLLAPLQGALGGLCRLCGLHGLARACAAA